MATSLFSQKKAKILSQLAVPETEYSDLSPKGSVDAGIRNLIDEINALEGVVTTSSCAGRVSVYLEGYKLRKKGTKNHVQISSQSGSGQGSGSNLKQASNDTGDADGDDKEEDGNETAIERRTPASASSAGGKGGGEWLFISHDPLPSSPALVSTSGGDEGEGRADGTKDWSSIFGLTSSKEGKSEPGVEIRGAFDGTSPPRLIHFKFEPMILHILTASHELAQLVVQAGMEAGFRETGAVSLTPRHQSKGDTCPTPMVAVRSMGLSFESLIGVETSNGERSSLVTPEYLELLVKISHERFSENQKRISRFRQALKGVFGVYSPGDSDRSKPKAVADGWEDSESRRERKKLEGLMRRDELVKRKQKQASEVPSTTDHGECFSFGLALEGPDVL